MSNPKRNTEEFKEELRFDLQILINRHGRKNVTEALFDILKEKPKIQKPKV